MTGSQISSFCPAGPPPAGGGQRGAVAPAAAAGQAPGRPSLPRGRRSTVFVVRGLASPLPGSATTRGPLGAAGCGAGCGPRPGRRPLSRALAGTFRLIDWAWRTALLTALLVAVGLPLAAWALGIEPPEPPHRVVEWRETSP